MISWTSLAALSLLLLLLLTPGNARAQSFPDVGSSDWFYPAVETFAAQGVIAGYPDGTFHPYEPVTRAQFAGMLARVLHLTPTEALPFADVDPEVWYAGLVASLYQAGIVQGDPTGAFHPNEAIERQQAASFIVRALDFWESLDRETDPSSSAESLDTELWLAGFKDRTSIDDAHRAAVAEAYRSAIVSGYTDARFYPFLTLTRAQAAGVLYAGFVEALQRRDTPPEQVEAESGYPTVGAKSAGPLVAWLEYELDSLSYRTGPVDAVFDSSTTDAVMAFQKVEGLERTGIAHDHLYRVLVGAQKPFPRRSLEGHRVEVDLSRQVLFVIDGNVVRSVLPVATGAAGTLTPTGAFFVQRKLPYWRRSPLGLLYKPAYFYGGYAIHGSTSVPADPASHGCVRVAVQTMDWLYPLLPIGTRVDIYY